MIGQVVSHYLIVSKLGAGAMGEVYLAEDQALGRRVALKILPPAVAADRSRIERFIMEARAASAMNHTNIASIHELGETDALRFIAMEYVEGSPLDTVVAAGPVDPQQALDVVRQVAAALAEAHAKGITHRDIKPANIMLTPRGQVKVLDFGIAKLRPDVLDQWVGSKSDAATIATTHPGLLIGTVHYMSPEQALAREVDARSDLFSLGIVFYELLTGRRPFDAESPTATIDAILHHDPPPPSSLRDGLAPTFDRVVARALEKDCDARYASATDFAADLDALALGAEPQGAPPRRTAVRWQAWGAVSAMAALLFVGSLWMRSQRAVEVGGSVQPVTALPGAENWPAFSRDGATIAFTWAGANEDNLDIYLLAVGGGDPVRLTRDPAPDSNPVFSLDGTHVAFVRGGSRLMLVPRGGGVEREITTLDDPRISFTPDGRALAVGGPATPVTAGIGIQIVPLDGGPKTTLTHPPAGSSDISPRYSPDGSLIAFERIPAPAVSDVYVMPVSGGTPKRLTFDDRFLDGMTWTRDGQAIVFASGRTGRTRLWRVSKDGGVPTAVPNAPLGSSNPVADPSADRLVFNTSALDTNVWQLLLDGQGAPVGQPARTAAFSSTVQDGSPDFSPDGTLVVFSSNRSGRDQIMVGPPDGVSVRAVTSASETFISVVGSPRWSPDGARIAFDARVRGNADIYVVGKDGGQWQRMTSDQTTDVVPSWSRDGRWIYFTSRRTGRPEVWRLPSSGGREEQVTFEGGFLGQESLDGTRLYYGKTRDRSLMFERPIAGGPETAALVDRTGVAHRVVQFAFVRPTTHGVVFVEEQDEPDVPVTRRRFAIKRVGPAGVLDVLAVLPKRPGMGAGGLAVSPDGRRILFTQLDAESSDLFLLQPFR